MGSWYCCPTLAVDLGVWCSHLQAAALPGHYCSCGVLYADGGPRNDASTAWGNQVLFVMCI